MRFSRATDGFWVSLRGSYDEDLLLTTFHFHPSIGQYIWILEMWHILLSILYLLFGPDSKF